ncbi:MAG: PAS domain S-box protein [Nitrospirae bacterium]|nr:MAG: PAS domain S-box protein [Nitrospirota bacterium]
MEIIIPADQYLQEDRDDLWMLLAGGAGLSLLRMELLTIGTRHIITQPLARLSDRLDRDSNKITGGMAISMAGSWGSNELVRFEVFFKKLRAQIFAQQSRIQEHEAALAINNIRLQEQVEQQTRACLASEQEMQAMLDYVNDAIVYIDLEGAIQWGNRAMERLADWPSPDLVGRPIWAFLTPESKASAKPVWLR